MPVEPTADDALLAEIAWLEAQFVDYANDSYSESNYQETYAPIQARADLVFERIRAQAARIISLESELASTMRNRDTWVQAWLELARLQYTIP